MNQLLGRSKPAKRVNSSQSLILFKPKTKKQSLLPTQKKVRSVSVYASETSVLLKQSSFWAKAVSWLIVSTAGFGILWACVAKIDQVVAARGVLKPKGAVREIQVPLNGVVDSVKVSEGERVQKNQLLVTLDSTAAVARLKSIQKVSQSKALENQFYRALMYESKTTVEADVKRLNLRTELATLAKNRAHLVAENQLLEAKLVQSQARLTPNQLALFQAHQAELNSRLASATLETQQLHELLRRNSVELRKNQKRLATEKQIWQNISHLAREGAVAKMQSIRQQQEVENYSAEQEHLLLEQKRLQWDIEQAKQHLANNLAQTKKDLLLRVAENQRRISEIDSQLTKVLVENDKRLAEYDSEISQMNMTLKYKEIKAPIAGTVFDLKAMPGYVPASGSAETLLKIVPDDHLVAEVLITNQDIGFIREGMKADVRIDSFPFSEFGDVKGQVTSIGSDALAPDPTYPFHRFPAKVELQSQTLNVQKRPLALQSGMSVSVNIHIAEKRTVMSIFLSKFLTNLDRFKAVR